MKSRLLPLLVLLLLLSLPGYTQTIFDTTVKPADTRPENYLRLLKKKQVGLVINQTSKVGDQSLLDLLIGKNIKVAKIFVPEHGFRGNEDAGANIANSVDSATGIPVISLYGNHKKPSKEDMNGIDVMVYDLQDVGVRFYTYISTLEYCMEACAEANKQFIVLDRPDPNGFYVDGPVLDTAYRSFVGRQPIPVVYGMTAGEYASMLVGEKWFNKASATDLKVIKCINYTHAKKYELPVAPSPNLKTMAAVYAYPSLCFFEGTIISVGRGTDLPFQQYGCPEFEGVYAYSFTPESRPGAKKPPFENRKCYGELIGTDPAEVLRKINNTLYLGWLIQARKEYPEKNHFFNEFFTKLSGTPNLAAALVGKKATDESARETWKADLDKFKTIRKKYLLYDDFPKK